MKANIELFKRAAVVLSIALLSACGGGGTGTPTAAPAPAAATTTGTITYWTALSAQVPISFVIDGAAAGTLSSATATAPTCGNAGALGLTKILTLGTHTKTATGQTLIWPANVNVTAGCTLIQLV
jgi:hypothetical protein